MAPPCIAQPPGVWHMQRTRHRTWFRLQRRMRRSLRASAARRVFGERVFHRRLWRWGRHDIAGGLALGLFVAFTPTFPFQMLLAATGALFFRVNLPLALLACWVTNPATVTPIYVAAWKCGRLFLTETAFLGRWMDLYAPPGASGQIIRHALYLWTGSLLFATTAGAIGYLLGACLAGPYGRRRYARAHAVNDSTAQAQVVADPPRGAAEGQHEIR